MAGPGTVIDFYALTRPVQERFRGSVNGSGLPTPILALRRSPREPLAWFGAAGALALLGIVLFELGLGELTSGIAVQGAGWILLHAIVWGGSIFCVLRGLALRRQTRALPFVPGVYVFPIGVIDARRPKIRVFPMTELASADGPDGANQMSLTVGGQRFVFPCGDREKAEKAAAAIGEARTQYQEAHSASETLRPKAIAAIDPLQDGGFASPLVPKTPILEMVPFWASKGYVLAAVAGLFVGGAMWNARNVWSDARMFAAANAKHDVASYRAYLERGSRHRDEVEQVLLPRAELQAAQQANTVDAIEAFIKAHPKTKIGPEVEAARHAALVAELEETKKLGTVSSLQDFSTRHPNHHLDAQLAAAVHDVYARAFATYSSEKAGKDAGAVALMKRLLDWAELHGPKVELRFARREAKSMERADKQVAKSRTFMGSTSFPSRYFDAAHEQPREEAMAKAIVARFGEAFPADVLELKVGEPITDPAQPLPNVEKPTLFIEHSTEWSGGEITSSKPPRGVFVMLGFVFDAQFVVPDGAKPFKTHQAIWRHPMTSQAKDEAHPEEVIYANMASDGFDAFTKHLLGLFFRPADKH